MRCTIVVPTYNEAETITGFLDTLLRATAGPAGPEDRDADPEVDVLVVDDSSPDGTGRLVSDHSEHGRRVRLLTRPGKDGLGNAYRAGFAAALQAGADAVVQMDADGSHPAEAVGRLLRALGAHDLAIGSRYVTGGATEGWPAYRQLISRAANRYARTVLGLRTRDATAGFRAWRAAALLEAGVLETVSDGYGFQVENTWRAERAGLSVHEVPITFVERVAGRSKMSAGVAAEACLRIAGWRLRELARGAAHAPSGPADRSAPTRVG